MRESNEVGQGDQTDFDKDMSRRDFLKKLGIGLGVAAVAGVGVAEALTPSAKERIFAESFPAATTVEEGDSPWTFFEKSGWNDGKVDFIDFYEALKKENKEVDLKKLKPGEMVWVPMRNQDKKE